MRGQAAAQQAPMAGPGNIAREHHEQLAPDVNSGSRLLQLPAELRIMIYQHVLTELPAPKRPHQPECFFYHKEWPQLDLPVLLHHAFPVEGPSALSKPVADTYRSCKTRCLSRKGLSFLQVNRQIYIEAYLVFWKNNAIHFNDYSDFQKIINSFARVGPTSVLKRDLIYHLSLATVPPLPSELARCKNLHEITFPDDHASVIAGQIEHLPKVEKLHAFYSNSIEMAGPAVMHIRRETSFKVTNHYIRGTSHPRFEKIYNDDLIPRDAVIDDALIGDYVTWLKEKIEIPQIRRKRDAVHGDVTWLKRETDISRVQRKLSELIIEILYRDYLACLAVAFPGDYRHSSRTNLMQIRFWTDQVLALNEKYKSDNDPLEVCAVMRKADYKGRHPLERLMGQSTGPGLVTG